MLGRMHLWWSYFLILRLLIFVCVHGQKPNSEGFINIDCGLASNTNYVDNFTGLTYVSDTKYTDRGLNGIISGEYPLKKGVYKDLETLRSFPNGTKNCYTVTPVTNGSKYLVRATFFYGNYDRLRKPPSFDLYFGVNFWSMVNISESSGLYLCEIIAIAPANYIDICLLNTGHGTPFISVLELRPLNNSLWAYEIVDSTRSLNCIGRLNIGSDDTFILRYPNDVHDRLWSSWTQSSWTALSTSSPLDGSIFEVPSLMLQTAAVPLTGSSINITWSTTNESTCLVVFHFAEIQHLPNNSLREFYVYANGELASKDPILVGDYLSYNAAYYTQSDYTDYNLSLKSSARATHPPILNGFEVYTILPVTFLPTYDGDVTAINTIKASYNISRDWSGDPCVPTGLGWTGFHCTIDSSNIPRITDLNLSYYGLTNLMVSAFGQLTALQKLDLSHNNLSGSIPSSLVELASLTLLDLSGNSNLSCTLPSRLQKRLDDDLLIVKCFNGTATPNVPGSKKASKTIIIIVVAVVIVLLIIGVATLFFLYLKKYKKTRINQTASPEAPRNLSNEICSSAFHNQDCIEFGAGVKGLNFDKKQFTFEELRIITDDFSCQVGIGGFGKVFKGHLETGKEIAVKVRTETSSQGIKEFLNEVEMLSRIHHKNLVALIGYCKDNNHVALVYEYMQEGNLQDFLRGNAWSLPWKQRLRIAYESAQGLEYLHKMCDPPLIHRDVKASNILLTKNHDAKISDFGSVRAFSGNHVLTQVIGTPGYLDPYYASSSQLTEKSDVYSFGVVLLEIVTGKPPTGQGLQEDQHLTDFVRKRLSKGNIESILDPHMGSQFNLNTVWKVADLAFRCIANPAKRPDMTEVVIELRDSLNLEMSSTETSNIALRATNEYSGYSRNDNYAGDVNPRSNFEMAHIEGMGITDYLPSPR